MSEEMKFEVIKAAARGYEAKEISEILKTDFAETERVIAESINEINEEIAFRKGQM